jgi:hypothetical protein
MQLIGYAWQVLTAGFIVWASLQVARLLAADYLRGGK